MHCEVAIISLTYLILEAKGGRESIFTSRGYGGAIRENQSLCLTRWKVAKGVLTGGGGDRGWGAGPQLREEPSPRRPGDASVAAPRGTGTRGMRCSRKRFPGILPAWEQGGYCLPAGFLE